MRFRCMTVNYCQDLKVDRLHQSSKYKYLRYEKFPFHPYLTLTATFDCESSV